MSGHFAQGSGDEIDIASQEGQVAHARGAKLDANPYWHPDLGTYAFQSDKAKAWLDGFADASGPDADERPVVV